MSTPYFGRDATFRVALVISDEVMARYGKYLRHLWVAVFSIYELPHYSLPDLHDAVSLPTRLRRSHCQEFEEASVK